MHGVPTRQDKELQEMPSLEIRLELSCNQLLPTPLVNDDGDDSNGDADDDDGDDAAEGMLKQNETR